MSHAGSPRKREALGPAQARAIACALLVNAVPAAGLAAGDSVPVGLRANALRITNSLKTLPVPDPFNLNEFVKDRQALRILGKALFWDQQLGSDGQACASCHFHAGVDNRSRNQINPGFRYAGPAFPGGDQTFGNSTLSPQSTPAFGPNYQLTLADFPLHRRADPEDPSSPLLSDTNDVISSMGVFDFDFHVTGVPEDSGIPRAEGVFRVGGALVRNVEPRNTPSSINAALNHRNFWDARARNEFNGSNPIGELDQGAKVVRAGPAPALTPVALLDSSAASQAVGPPLSDLEMSFVGRTFAHLGRKMLSPELEPLSGQLVATDDSLLGPFSKQHLGFGVRGSTLVYADLINQAIQPAWWDAPGWKVDVGSGQPVLVQTAATGPSLFTVMEYNFPLFFGLAIAEYEKLLISDDSPFDRWLEGDPSALGPQEQAGLQVFLSQGLCFKCHYGPALTGVAFTNISLQRRPGNIERMVMGDFTIGAYDTGYYNIGVRPTEEDLGMGASIGPGDLPLSTAQRLQDCVGQAVRNRRNADPDLGLEDAIRLANGDCKVPPIPARPPEAARVLAHAAGLAAAIPVDVADVQALLADASVLLTGEEPLALNFIRGTELTAQALAALEAKQGLTPEVTAFIAMARRLMPDAVAPPPGAEGGLPVGPPLRPDERIVKMGAFKTPSIRNIELTAPYFHNGGQATLEQVVQFYDRGGDFARENIDDLDADIKDLALTPQQMADLVAFLKSLTDERLKYDRAPFDHPSLDVPNGGTPGVLSTLLGVDVLDARVELPATGAGGSPFPLGTPGTALANFPDPLWSVMAVVSGDGQSAEPGALLPSPLVVKVTDDLGNPVQGVPVSFAAPQGASVSPESAVTGADGTATATARLGVAPGAQAVVASSPASNGSVSFSVTVEVPPPATGPDSGPGSGPGSGAGGCGTAPGTAAPGLILAVALLGPLLVRRRSS